MPIPVLAAFLLGACSAQPASPQAGNLRKARLEHNDVSLELQQAWGQRPRSEAETAKQRDWEQAMFRECNGTAAVAAAVPTLNATYCEINAMRGRAAQLRQ